MAMNDAAAQAYQQGYSIVTEQDQAGERGNQALAATFYVEIITQSAPIRRVEVSLEDIVVGRSERCTIPVDDGRVSRVHLRIQRRPDRGVTITDLYTANGTTLDGRNVPPGMSISWLIGQTVQVGNVILILRYGQPRD